MHRPADFLTIKLDKRLRECYMSRQFKGNGEIHLKPLHLWKKTKPAFPQMNMLELLYTRKLL